MVSHGWGGETLKFAIKLVDKGSISTFSNSLIIHETKTKEITAVKGVWACDPNHKKIGELLL